MHEYNDSANWLNTTQHNLLPSGDWYNFTAADTAVELQMRLWTGIDGTNIGLVFDGSPPWTPEKGRGWLNYNYGITSRALRWIPMGGTTWITGTDFLTASHWYDIKGVMDFSPIAGGATPTISYYFRDLGTALDGSTPAMSNPTGYVAAAGLQNMNMFEGTLPTDYRASMFYIATARNGSGYQNAIDLVGLYNPNVIPEPSTLALLAAGLIGLLAYAWRKRK